MWEKMVPNCKVLKSIPLHGQRLNCGANICELEDHVREEGWSLNWLTKFKLVKKIPLANFLSCLLKNA